MLEEPEVDKLPDRPVRTGQVPRTIFIVMMGAIGSVAFGFGTSPLLDWIYKTTTKRVDTVTTGLGLGITASCLMGFLVGAGFANLVFVWFGKGVDRWDEMDSGDKVTLFVGILSGLLASTPFLFLANGIFPTVYFPLVAITLTAALLMMCVYLMQSMSDILPWTKERGRARRRGIKILDTNVIIDGRIYDVARTGFLEGNLYVPGFVLDELQYIADSHDALRRQRGRRGLDVLRHMQSDFQLEVRSHDRLAPDLADGVDSRLVRLARAMGADIVTNDFNLNRVAALQEVKVLNINDLALGLRPNVLPSETLNLPVVREGSQPQQGIGYLEDGTMVVVENGKAHIGETLDVVVSQVIQTERGKMIFAEVPADADSTGQNGHDYPRKRPGVRR